MNISFYSHGRHAVEFHCQFVEKVLWVEGKGRGRGFGGGQLSCKMVGFSDVMHHKLVAWFNISESFSHSGLPSCCSDHPAHLASWYIIQSAEGGGQGSRRGGANDHHGKHSCLHQASPLLNENGLGVERSDWSLERLEVFRVCLWGCRKLALRSSVLEKLAKHDVNSARQEIVVPTFRYFFHKRTPLVYILGHMNPVRMLLL